MNTDTTRTGNPQDPKEEARRDASQAADQARHAAGTASDKAGEVAATAAGGAQHVMDEAAQQASNVAQEASQQARNLAHQAADEVRHQASEQTHRAAEGLRGVAGQFQALAEGRAEEAGPMVDYARQAGSRIEKVADHIENRGIEGMVDDVQRFARRRPGLFLVGAAGTGFLVSRLMRGVQASQGDQPQRQELPAGGQTTAPAPVPQPTTIDLRANEQPPVGEATEAQARRLYGRA